MNTSFKSIDGRSYEIDEVGAIHQTDPKRFVYDADYASIYDTPAYQRQSDLLQAMRLGFVVGVHGHRFSTQVPVTLLDYGYGNGAFLKFAHQYGDQFKLFGLDINGVDVPGIQIVESIDQVEDHIEVITFWDCIEHIQDWSFLYKLPCTTLVVSLPFCHVRTQGIEWFNNGYIHRKPDEHVHHFDRYALKNTMFKYDWHEVAWSTHEDIVRKSKHGLPNILTMAFKR